MAATKKATKKEPVPAATSMEKLPKDFNTPGRHLVILDFIRYRDAGLNKVSFDEWVDICIQMRETDKVTSPSRILGDCVRKVGVPEEEHLDILVGYVDMLNDEPETTFTDYLKMIFPEAFEEAQLAPDPAADDAAADEGGGDADPADEGTDEGGQAEAQTEAQAAEPAPEPKEEPKATRKRPGAGAKKEEPESILNRRVVYKTSTDKVVYGLCTKEGQTCTILDDKGDEFTNVRRELIKADDGPIVWTITKAQDDMARKMLKKDRGLWPDAEEHDLLLELVRRVSPNLLCVVTIHNAEPQPFVDAYVFDESAGDGEVSTPFEHKPPETLVSEYLFKVPGVGDIPARVVVGK